MNKENITGIIKGFLGLLALILIGFTITSIPFNVSNSSASLIIQILLFIIFLITISYQGYSFKEELIENDFFRKFILFLCLFFSNGLIFWIGDNEALRFLQITAFFTNFFIIVSLYFAYQLDKVKDKTDFTLLFSLTIWSMLSVVIFQKEFNLIPYGLNQKLNFLNIDSLIEIRLLILIIFGFIFTIDALITANKATRSGVKWWHSKIIQNWGHLTASSSSQKILYVPVNAFIDIIVNPICISFIYGIIINEIVRFIGNFGNNLIKALGAKSRTLFIKFLDLFRFLLLYIIGIAIPFVISISSSSIVFYLRGVNQYLIQIAILCAILFAMSVIFKMIVIILFTEEHPIENREWFSSSIRKPLNESIRSNLMVVCSILFLLCIVGLALHFGEKKLNLKGFDTWYFSEAVWLVIIVFLIPVILFKHKDPEEIVKEEITTFKFKKLPWTFIFRGPGLYIAIFATIGIYIFFARKQGTENISGKEDFVKVKLDTIVTDKEIYDYYEQNKKDILLKNNIVKILYIALPQKLWEDNYDTLRSWLYSTDVKKRERLGTYCKMHSTNYFLNDTVWMNLDNVFMKLPSHDYNQFLNLQGDKNHIFGINDSGNVYVVWVKDYLLIKDIAPLSYVKKNIEKILVTRKIYHSIFNTEKAIK